MSTLKVSSPPKALTKPHRRSRKLHIGLGITLGLILTVGGLTTPFGAASAAQEAQLSEALAHLILEDAGIDYSGELIIQEQVVVAGVNAGGYVPLISNGEAIYIVESSVVADYGDTELVYRSIVLHEYAHILQKRLLETRCGDNPVGRAACFPELEATLATYAASSEVTNTVFPGIETNADCVLETYSSNSLTGYQVDGCTDEQLAAAWAVRSGKWPDEAAVERWLPHVESLERAEHKSKPIGDKRLAHGEGKLKKLLERPGE